MHLVIGVLSWSSPVVSSTLLLWCGFSAIPTNRAFFCPGNSIADARPGPCRRRTVLPATDPQSPDHRGPCAANSSEDDACQQQAGSHRNDGRHHAGDHERVIQHVLADLRRTRQIEVDRRNQRPVGRDKEVPVNRISLYTTHPEAASRMN